jgi:uncharacterized alpha-E superfamily protein
MLSREQLADLKHKIIARPHLYVGQEQVSFSTTPCLIDGRLEPRHGVIRTFVTTHEGQYQVMKGGLARAARHRGIALPSRHFDNISKDIWVMANRPERHISLWLQPSSDELAMERSGILSSRAAENLYWTGRYAERVEGAARLLRTVILQMNRVEEAGNELHRLHVHLLQRSLTMVTETFPGFCGDKELSGQEILAELHSVMTDPKRMGSIADLLESLMSAAYMVRDRWSLDNWRVLDGVKTHWRQVQAQSHGPLVSAECELDELVTSLAAFIGLNIESMTREPGWLMLDSGRRIERALWLIRSIKSLLLGDPGDLLDHLILESFLSTHESLITHRRRYRSFLQRQSVLEVLLLDEGNPRALAYQIDRLQNNLSRLPRSRRGNKMGIEEKLALEVSTQLKLADAQILARATPGEGHKRLADLIALIENRLMTLSEALNHTYFSHAAGARQLTPTRRSGGNV